MNTFSNGFLLEKYKNEVLNSRDEEIEKKIEEWHKSDSCLPINEYLDMTWDEYCEYAKGVSRV